MVIGGELMAMYECKVNKVVRGTYTTSTSAKVKVTLGFKPKYIGILSSTSSIIIIYDERVSTSQFMRATSSYYSAFQNLGNTSTGRLYSVDDDGFTINAHSSVQNFNYVAIGG